MLGQSTVLSFSYYFFLFHPGSDLAGAFALLHEAETKLKRIVHDKFEAAIQNGDRNSVERYCYSHSNVQYYFIGFLIVKCRVFIRHRRLENSPFTSRNSPANVQVWVVQNMDSAIHRINHYPLDKY